MEFPVMLSLGTMVFSAGAAYGGAKVALNGTRERVRDLKKTVVDHVEKDERLQDETIDRLARIETKLDFVLNGDR